jgi:IS5 family transposase
MIKATSVNRVIVDTTIMPKAVAYPTSRLLEKSRQHLVRLAEDNALPLRQNYNREAPRLAARVGRYPHARQYKRMRKVLKTLRTRVGRVYRDIHRQVERPPRARKCQAKDLLQRVHRIS